MINDEGVFIHNDPHMSIYHPPGMETFILDHMLWAARGLGVEWMAVVDTDEYIFLRHKDTIQDYLTSRPEVDQHKFHWLSFGTSFVHKLEDGDVFINGGQWMDSHMD